MGVAVWVVFTGGDATAWSCSGGVDACPRINGVVVPSLPVCSKS
jgi:hypothetical protein